MKNLFKVVCVINSIVCPVLVTCFEYSDLFYEVPSVFPAVSICNLNKFQNPISVSAINQIITTFGLQNEFSVNSLQNYNNLFNDYFYVQYETTMLTLLQFKKISNVSQYPLNQTLISCLFQFEPCSAADFEYYYDNYYGNCYRFNSG